MAWSEEKLQARTQRFMPSTKRRSDEIFAANALHRIAPPAVIKSNSKADSEDGISVGESKFGEETCGNQLPFKIG